MPEKTKGKKKLSSTKQKTSKMHDDKKICSRSDGVWWIDDRLVNLNQLVPPLALQLT